MRSLLALCLISLTLALSGCSSKFKTYTGPEVTHVVVYKAQRKLHLLHHNRVLKTYDMGLGNAPVGHKQFRGDGKTPEGRYFIDRRNPNSSYHLSIGISYPNQLDREFAKALEREPGGDIFIHGRPNDGREHRGKGRDWTAGCITVKNREIEDIYAMVRDGTPITIYP